jgi:hypothetical protein
MSQPSHAPTPSPSPDYRRFVDSVTGPDPAFREAVDEEALLRLQKEERRSAEELLMKRLDKDDLRAPPALAHAECRGAVMPMKRRLPKASGHMKIAIAEALVTLEAIPRADEIVAEVLRSGGDADGGLAALSASEGMRSAVARNAIAWSCVHHPEREVRCNAGAELFFMADLSADPLSWDFRPYWLRLGEEDPVARRAAFNDICELVGLSPEAADYTGPMPGPDGPTS